MTEKLLMKDTEIERALTRIAHEILERNQGIDDLILIGVRTRGVPLAKRLQQRIYAFEHLIVPIGSLDIRPYRDDYSVQQSMPQSHTDIAVDISGKKVVLVDDVLFTGRSIRAAMDALMDIGRPRMIQVAVLVDRGHRELPVRADYVGKNIPTSINEHVVVQVSEVDTNDSVTIQLRPNIIDSYERDEDDIKAVRHMR